MIKLKPSKVDVNSKMCWSLILKNYAGVLSRNPPKWILLNVKSNMISKRFLTQFLIWKIGRMTQGGEPILFIHPVLI